MAAAAWSILVPLFGALVVIARPHTVRGVVLLATLGTMLADAAVVWHVLQHGTASTAVGGWSPPLGIRLRADGLAAAMLAVVAVVGGAITRGALGALSRRDAARFFSLWLFGWAALNALALSADIFNLYVTLELTTLVAVALIALPDRDGAISAALRYLIFALSGSLAYLLGVVSLYGATSTLDVTLIGQAMHESPLTRAALISMTLGLMVKSGLFPLHLWIAPAYDNAETHASALLSGLFSKAPFYVLARLWLEVFSELPASGIAELLGILGAAGVLWGSLLALGQSRLKLLLAYSSVGQIGYLFLLFPLGNDGKLGVFYLVLSHAAAKAAMFMAVGSIERAAGGDDMQSLKGLARHLPVTFFALGLSGLTLMGMPPSGGFIAKYLMLRACVAAGQWGYALVLLLGGLLAAAYMVRIFRNAFEPPPSGVPLRPASRGAELGTLGLALVPILLGCAPSHPLALLRMGIFR